MTIYYMIELIKLIRQNLPKHMKMQELEDIENVSCL